YLTAGGVGRSRIRVLLNDEMDASVSLSALAGMLNTQRAIFPITGCLDINGEPQFLKIGFHIPCSTLAQHEIVRRCAEFITAPFQKKTGRLLMLHLLGIGLYDAHRFHLDHI